MKNVTADFRAGDRRSTRIGEFHAEFVASFRGVVGSELNSTIPCGALVVDAHPRRAEGKQTNRVRPEAGSRSRSGSLRT